MIPVFSDPEVACGLCRVKRREHQLAVDCRGAFPEDIVSLPAFDPHHVKGVSDAAADGSEDEDAFEVVKKINRELYELAGDANYKLSQFLEERGYLSYVASGDFEAVMFLGETIWDGSDNNIPWAECGNQRVRPLREHLLINMMKVIEEAVPVVDLCKKLLSK
jgi:hypothetical protein